MSTDIRCPHMAKALARHAPHGAHLQAAAALAWFVPMRRSVFRPWQGA